MAPRESGYLRRMIRSLPLALLLVLLLACRSNRLPLPTDPAGRLIARAINAHGGARYNRAHYAFVFRDRTYTFQNDGPRYRYTRTDTLGNRDVLDNDGIRRSQNGTPVTLSEKQQNAYAEALNSVIYFATLPHKLQDPAVRATHAGSTTIEEEPYEVLDVRFTEANGGTDHDDTFRYWIHAKRHTIDYLAYNYRVSGGGVRFRRAYNPRTVGGIRFQDYVNYKAPVGTPLVALPQLYEQGALEELSRIETARVRMLR